MSKWMIMALALLCGIVCLGQDSPEHVTVPLTDPSRPATVKASLLNGGITVRGYAGKEIIVDTSGGEHAMSRHSSPPEASGLHRIDSGRTGLKVEEADNRVDIKMEPWGGGGNLILQVPVHTSLKLHTVNSGNVTVDGVDGEIEVEALNGAVTLNSVSGAALVHALNGTVKATFQRIDPSKAMSFSSLNGNIDVTLPSDARATLNMKSDQGEIFTDFDMKVNAKGNMPNIEDNRGKNGRFRLKFDRGMSATINGGGTAMQLTTFNGNIYLRKGR